MAGKKPYTAYELAARLLARRMYTRSELCRRLTKEGFPGHTVGQVLDTFERDGYIDDVAFIERYVDHRRTFNPRGFHALYSELLHRGIPRNALAGLRKRWYPLKWEAEDARRLLAQWNPTGSTDTGEHDRYRLTGRLIRRGFSHEAVELAWSLFLTQEPPEVS